MLDLTKEIEAANQKLRETIDQELAKQLAEIPQLIQSILENAILNILGIAKRGGGYEIDIFHGGGLNKYISDTVQQALDDHVKPIVNDNLQKLVKDTILTRSIIKRSTINVADRASRSYESSLTRALETAFAAVIKAQVKAVEKTISEALKGAGTVNTELANPQSYSGPLGELLLAAAAKELATNPVAEECNPITIQINQTTRTVHQTHLTGKELKQLSGTPPDHDLYRANITANKYEEADDVLIQNHQYVDLTQHPYFYTAPSNI